ncbi:class I SAM-dependent methyltransferase [Methanobacterium petrolearium]|uniref:class I SAM-dependent methyltransferase n=1 Tax=Methanobacterium petrolearium TaxID=710190 RepID=UPI001AE23703|nr:class I SAM-dependent methyltransferase [Methanobacterium petrolearium]MBP1944994.1 ubiquinone/menaquinone biosynthesis C-methylase UbiE [Methanobacterium petrolearium]BDZ70318.1 hypothetical protein GCM10025861_08350 [Methanobacterium petrolearium]
MIYDTQSINSMFRDGAHAPIYPLIANQITEKFKIKTGTAIDVGAGPASLSVAMARITQLKIYAMDISPEMIEIAAASVKKEGLTNRIKIRKGDVHQMPFPDEFADLIFSRGSMFFWKDLPTAFQEIYRVLKPGGAGYIGGGYGSAEVGKKIKKKFKNKNKKFHKSSPKMNIDTLEKAVTKAKINDYILTNDDSGLWVLFKKQDKCIF